LKISLAIKKEDLERFSKQKDLLFRTAFLKEIDGKLNELPNKEMSITSFREFISNRYIELKKEYKKLDRNEDGKVSEQELKCSLEQVGIFVKSEEIRKFMKFIDIDNSGYLEFEKFFQFSITLNSYKIDNIFNCYQHLSPQPDPKAGYVFETTAEKNLLNTRYLIAGGIAGAMSKTFTAPLDRFRVLFQVNQKASHFNDVFIKIISENGIFGFWRGNAINVTKIIPESAVRFHVFEKTKFYFVKSNSGITMGQTFVAGGLAGLVSQTVIYPMETLKTR
jgi:solute carrier family 25 phosphate transporter 23/24/25/41